MPELGVIQLDIVTFADEDGVEVEHVEEVELDLDGRHLSMQETVRLETVMGKELVRSYAAGEEVEVSMQLFRALVWAKLWKRHRTIGIEDFDFDMADAVDYDPPGEIPVITPEDRAEIERDIFGVGG